MDNKICLKQLNEINKYDFYNLFKNIVENYPNVGKELESFRPFENLDEILFKYDQIIENLPVEEKMVILKLHPDLAGKLADEQKLTTESTFEQKAAGLDKITTEEKLLLNEFNKKYKSKFEFPFVICARENRFQTILTQMQVRIKNSFEQELKESINEVKKISHFRIKEII